MKLDDQTCRMELTSTPSRENTQRIQTIIRQMTAEIQFHQRPIIDTDAHAEKYLPGMRERDPQGFEKHRQDIAAQEAGLRASCLRRLTEELAEWKKMLAAAQQGQTAVYKRLFEERMAADDIPTPEQLAKFYAERGGPAGGQRASEATQAGGNRRRV